MVTPSSPEGIPMKGLFLMVHRPTSLQQAKTIQRKRYLVSLGLEALATSDWTRVTMLTTLISGGLRHA
jgi:hypothetical protein